MARAGKDLDSLIREVEAENPGADPDLVTQVVVERMTRPMKQDVVRRWVRAGVWSLRRDKQLATERAATQEREARRKADQAAREAAWEAGREEREKEAEARYDRELEEADRDFSTWIKDPSLFPLEWLRAGVPGSYGYERRRNKDRDGSAKDRIRLDGWLRHLWGKDLSHLPEYPRTSYPSSRVLLAACEAHGIPRSEWPGVLNGWRSPSDALGLSIALEIEEASEQIRIELTEELLASEFALGDGVRVTWGSATAEQHRQRAELTTANAVANAQDAARHLTAARMLEEGRVVSLQDLAEEGMAA